MPYEADLRTSYCDAKLNMSWYYEAMSEYGLEIEFKPSVGLSEWTEKQRISLTKKLFENHIEEAFNNWIAYKVFDHKVGDHNYELFCDVWEFLRDITIEYKNNHTTIKLIFTEEEEEEEKEEEEQEEK